MAEGAIRLDTTGRTLESLVDELAALVRSAVARAGAH
jgi:hypothetical protein